MSNMRRKLAERIRELSLYPGEEELELLVRKAVAKRVKEYDVFVTVVHKEKWWCASITIPDTILEKHAREAIQDAESVLKANWPREMGRIVRKDGGASICGKFWLPLNGSNFSDLAMATFDEIVKVP